MFPKGVPTNILGLVCFILVAFAVCTESRDAQHDIALEHKNITNELVSEHGEGVLHWPNRRFKCPTAFGAYPDPDNCAFFFICFAKVATRTRCPYLYRFCKVKRVCLPIPIAVCDAGSGETTDDVTHEDATTSDDSNFVCPEEYGKFLHDEDCKKYYDCEADQPTIKTCPDDLLFDGVKRNCRSPEKVHCGSRERPTGETSLPQTTEEILSDTTEEILPDPTADPVPITREPPPPTTSDPLGDLETTTHKPRVTAPDTDCDLDDLDCIIDDLGETPDWFVCETDVGSYPHPTSNKLFIFCLNWKPSVKKCGQDLVFSEELMTCVSPPHTEEPEEDTE